jgi:hypothetical protein
VTKDGRTWPPIASDLDWQNIAEEVGRVGPEPAVRRSIRAAASLKALFDDPSQKYVAFTVS